MQPQNGATHRYHSEQGTKVPHVLPSSLASLGGAPTPDLVPPLSVGAVAIVTSGVCNVGVDSLTPPHMPWFWVLTGGKYYL